LEYLSTLGEHRRNMNTSNVFIGKTTAPSSEELSTALGPTITLWTQLVESLASEFSITDHEWHSLKPKYGWSLILKVKKRRILYLSPFNGCFQASLILGDKAVAAARACNLSKATLKILDEAPRYPEGTGVRFLIKTGKYLPAIRKLVQIKLAN
jgi:hypothetical protein